MAKALGTGALGSVCQCIDRQSSMSTIRISQSVPNYWYHSRNLSAKPSHPQRARLQPRPGAANCQNHVCLVQDSGFSMEAHAAQAARNLELAEPCCPKGSTAVGHSTESERKGKERKGKERKGKERKGKERKGKERKGKERKHIFSLAVVIPRLFLLQFFFVLPTF